MVVYFYCILLLTQYIFHNFYIIALCETMGLFTRNESCSESRFGSRSACWLGSWFKLHAFTSIANAIPITNRICALRGNILFLLRSPRWLTHAWLQRAFQKCTRMNHVPKELCVHVSSQSGFLCGSWSKKPIFSRFKSLIWKSFAFTKGKIRLSN